MRNNQTGQGSNNQSLYGVGSPDHFSAVNTSMHIVGNETGDASMRN